MLYSWQWVSMMQISGSEHSVYFQYRHDDSWAGCFNWNSWSLLYSIGEMVSATACRPTTLSLLSLLEFILHQNEQEKLSHPSCSLKIQIWLQFPHKMKTSQECRWESSRAEFLLITKNYIWQIDKTFEGISVSFLNNK